MPTAVGSQIPRRRGDFSEEDGFEEGGRAENAPPLDDATENDSPGRIGGDDVFGYTTLKANAATVKATSAGRTQQQYQRVSRAVVQANDGQLTSTSVSAATTIASFPARRSGTYPGTGYSALPTQRPAHHLASASEAEEKDVVATRPINWKHLLLAASTGVSAVIAYYVAANWDNFVNTRKIYYESQLGGRIPHENLRLFNMLRKADVVPRYTLLEKIDDKQGWVLQMDVPGFNKNELELRTSPPFMTIRGSHTCTASKDPTCLDRHVSDEIRFPDEADLDSARAEMANGVLRVFVRPRVNYKPVGRAIRIVDDAVEKVQQKLHRVSEAVKEKLGFRASGAGSPSEADAIEVSRRYDAPWTFTARDPEDLIRQRVESYIQWLKEALRVPSEFAGDFLQQVRAKSHELIIQFRKGALTVSEFKERVHVAAEDVWASLRREAGRAGDAIKQKAAHATDRVSGLADTGKAKVNSAREAAAGSADSVIRKAGEAIDAASEMMKAGERKISGLAEEQAETMKHVGEAVKSAAVGTAQSVKEKARQYADNLRKGEEAAEQLVDIVAHDVAEGVRRASEAAVGDAKRAVHRSSEGAERARDRAKEAAHHAAHRVEETAEELAHRAEEKFHKFSHRASETAEDALDRAREAAERAEDRTHESSSHSRGHARRADDRPVEGFGSVFKALFWGT